jgi:hypothetical protein
MVVVLLAEQEMQLAVVQGHRNHASTSHSVFLRGLLMNDDILY